MNAADSDRHRRAHARDSQSFGGLADFVVPDRITEGYGLSPALAQRLLGLKPRLVITSRCTLSVFSQQASTPT